MGPDQQARKPTAPSMAGEWAQTTHTSRSPRRTDDGAGELGPPTVRTVHSAGGALWVIVVGWDLPSVAHVHVVVVAASIPQRWVLFIVRNAHQR